MSKRKVIVTIAPGCSMTHAPQNPQIPIDPAQITEDLMRCWNASETAGLEDHFYDLHVLVAANIQLTERVARIICEMGLGPE